MGGAIRHTPGIVKLASAVLIAWKWGIVVPTMNKSVHQVSIFKLITKIEF
jgi:hypothetical protein